MRKVEKHLHRVLSMILVTVLLVQAAWSPMTSHAAEATEATSTANTVTFEDNFEYGGYTDVDYLLATEQWDLETKVWKGTTPTISDGVLKMTDGNSIQFNWMKVAGIGEYDASKTYTFEMDGWLTDVGDGTCLNNNSAMTRIMTLSMGGNYDQVQVKTMEADGKERIRVGGTSMGEWSALQSYGISFLDKKVHVKMEWYGETIETTVDIYTEYWLAGTQTAEGSFTNTTYNYATSKDTNMESLVIRCEDGAFKMDNFTFTDGETSYSCNFTAGDKYGVKDADFMLAQDVWNIESANYVGTKPAIANGALSMTAGNSVQFDWTKVAGVGDFDEMATYTYEFDAKVTNSGAGSSILYVAPGGSYEQVKINNENASLNQTVHVKLDWRKDTITSTITDASGNVLATESKKDDKYNYAVSKDARMNYLVLRCEDGSVEIDNFSFTKTPISNLTVPYTKAEAETFLKDKEKQPEKEGYLFGGWYTTDNIPEMDDYEAAKAAMAFVIQDTIPDEVETVYALFVPEEVLTVRAQVSGNLIDNDDTNDATGSLRFVTTVDSLMYKRVGFKVEYLNSSNEWKTITKESKTVYKTLKAIDTNGNVGEELKEYSPTEFCPVSKFFKACIVESLLAKNFVREFTVTPYWETMDGSVVYGNVYGDSNVKSINQYLGAIYGNVTGQLKKVDGTAFPETMVLGYGSKSRKIAVSSDGSFDAKLPLGDYEKITLDGYRAVCDSFTVGKGEETDLETVKLLQQLTKDTKSWWGGGTLTEAGNSATINFNSASDDRSGQEFQVGQAVSGAKSWKISAKISGNSGTRNGFSIGSTDGEEWLLFFVDGGGYKGVISYDTYKIVANNNGGNHGIGMNNDENAAYTTDYTLTLKATDINGPGTGKVALYMNEMLVYEANSSNFINATTEEVIDLENCVLSLAAVKGKGTSVTYTDYYYTVKHEPDAGTVKGQLVKLDGTAYPETATLSFGSISKTVTVDSEGNFTTELPVGDYNVTYSLDGYRTVCNSITVEEDQETTLTIKLLQKLTTATTVWEDGGALTEAGNSATINFTSASNYYSSIGFQLGQTVSGAKSWRISAKISGNSGTRNGFSIRTTDGEDWLLFFVDGGGYKGVISQKWYKVVANGNGVNHGISMTEAEKAAYKTDYTLTLVATDIGNAEYEKLTLYLNDMVVYQSNSSNFINATTGEKIDLENCVLSLAAMKGNGTSVTYTDYYYTVNQEPETQVGTVKGQMMKLDATAYPETATLSFGSISKTVTVDSEGNFTTEIPVGTYEVAYSLDGYRTVCDSITVEEEQETTLTIKLLQKLTFDNGWWNGGTLTESGSSAIFNFASDANGDSGVEYRVGNAVSGANSWRISAKFKGLSPLRRGFSVGTTDGSTPTLFFFIDDSYKGVYTWSTVNVAHNNNGMSHGVALTEEELAAIQSEDGYTLTLVATGINGAGTGKLTLYLNDMVVYQTANSNFTIATTGSKMDLGNCILSLTARKGDGTSIEFTDYYYTLNQEPAEQVGTVKGQLMKLDQTAYPTTAEITFGSISKTVTVAADGSFTTDLPVGNYEVAYSLDGYRTVCDAITVEENQETTLTIKLLQKLTKDTKSWWGGGTLTEAGNSATINFNSASDNRSGQEFQVGQAVSGAKSWTISAKISGNSGTRNGFSIGSTDGEEWLLFFVDGAYKGVISYDTYKIVANNNGGNHGIDMNNDENAAYTTDYTLTLKATDINGPGTGKVALYMNDDLVYEANSSNFINATTNEVIDLENCVLSLAAVKKSGTSVTYTDYYCTVDYAE